MPVTRISCSTLMSVNSGASAWIGAVLPSNVCYCKHAYNWIRQVPCVLYDLSNPLIVKTDFNSYLSKTDTSWDIHRGWESLNPFNTHCFVLIGPLSSMGSPMTFIILPKVSGPTGIRMGAPVSRTFWPRTRPSVPSMAMVLTVFSPEWMHKERH